MYIYVVTLFYIYRCIYVYEYIYIWYVLYSLLASFRLCLWSWNSLNVVFRALLVLRDAVASTECKGTGMKDIGHFHHFRDMSKLFMNRYFHVKNFKHFVHFVFFIGGFFTAVILIIWLLWPTD